MSQEATGAPNNTPEGSGSETENATPTEAKSVADLPQWAQDQLSRARNDAASYRTKLRDTEAQLGTLQSDLEQTKKTAEAFQVERDDAKLFGLKLDAALEAQVPGDALKVFADRLRGSTPEELKADAETLKKSGFGAATTGRVTDRSAGLGNDKPSTPENQFADFIGNKLGWGK